MRFLGPCSHHTNVDAPGVRMETCFANDFACILVSSRTAKHLDAGCPQSDSESCVFPRGLPQAAPCQSAVLRLTQPPCNQALTDGSYSYYLTFIKLPQCPRSFMEQGCGWSQNVCPKRLWPHGGAGMGVSFPCQSPPSPSSQTVLVSAPDVLMEPVHKDVGEDSAWPKPAHPPSSFV